MPVLMIKESCYHKLDNLYRHDHICGFTYGRGQVWRILGNVAMKKSGVDASSKKNDRKVRLENLCSKVIVEVQWSLFLQDFRHSFISPFSQQYHLKSISTKIHNKMPQMKLTI